MTADRTTIKATFDELLAKLRANLVADPPTTVKPFRRIAVGEFGVIEFPRPFMAVQLVRARAIGQVDGDRLVETSMELQLIMDVAGVDAHGELLNRVAAVEDYFDSLIDTGVIEGAEGFDDRVWTLAEPKTTSGVRVATASARQTCVVKVEREANA
jgi:hypothetical protein